MTRQRNKFLTEVISDQTEKSEFLTEVIGDQTEKSEFLTEVTMTRQRNLNF